MPLPSFATPLPPLTCSSPSPSISSSSPYSSSLLLSSPLFSSLLCSCPVTLPIVVQVESKLRDKEIECFRLRELLGLSSSSSPDALEGSESLRAKSTTDFHVNPAQVLREFLSSPRAPARSQREQEKEERKSAGQDGERVKDLEEELQRKEEAVRELVKNLKEEHELVKRELQGRIDELEVGFFPLSSL